MRYQNFGVVGLALALVLGVNQLVFAQASFAQASFAQASFAQASTEASTEVSTEAATPESNDSLNLTPEVIEQSPVLQRWQEAVPNVRADIQNDPSFKTRIYAGYSAFPSTEGKGGFAVGVEDWFVGDLPLTVNADYQQTFDGDRLAYGADTHYYALPLGGYFNVAPTLGYRYAKATDDYEVNGANIGVRLRLVPSRTGAADLTLDQSWIVGDSEGVSVTQLNFGYAVTQNLRVSTDLEWQRTADEGDSRVGINLEWSL